MISKKKLKIPNANIFEFNKTLNMAQVHNSIKPHRDNILRKNNYVNIIMKYLWYYESWKAMKIYENKKN